MKNIKIIKCPHCGAEYLPEEIFYPDSVFNKKLNIIKDEEGKIVDYDAINSFNLVEEFECEYCGSTFEVEGKVTFSTKLMNKIDFEEETTISL